MNIFKRIHNAIKLKRFAKVVCDLCVGKDCRQCPAWNPEGFRNGRPTCALTATIDLAEDKWGSKKEARDE